MRNTLTISVIIPTRNRATDIGAAIESALDQRIDGLEIIVIDDASHDQTPRILAGFGKAIHSLRLTKSCGVAHARNMGILQAQGRWLAFLDSDDIWLPGKLAAQRDTLLREPTIGLCFTDYAVDERAPSGGWRETTIHGRRPGVRDFSTLLRRNFIGTLTVMMKRETIDRVGGFDETLRRGSDYDLWLRVAARWPLRRVPRVLARYRRHHESLTGLHPSRDLETWAAVTTRWVQRDPGLLARVGWSLDGWRDCIATQRKQLLNSSDSTAPAVPNPGDQHCR